MTQLFAEDGTVIPVTIVAVDPCIITHVKTQEKDGYTAVQVGTQTVKKVRKPQVGHYKEFGNVRYAKEFRMQEVPEFLSRGVVLKTDVFVEGDVVSVTGFSKGRGFTGVVKRHGFHGSKKTHGNKDQLRMPGSIGATGPAHVFKGTRMAGRLGNEQVTIKNIQIVQVDTENGLVYCKGALPGARNGFIVLKGLGDITEDMVCQFADLGKKPKKEITEEQPEIQKEVKLDETEVKEEVIKEAIVETTEVKEKKQPETEVKEEKVEVKEEKKEETKVKDIKKEVK